MTKYFLFISFCVFLGTLCARPAQGAEQCRTFFSNEQYFFDSYERHEYSPDGLLIMHFKIKPKYSDSRGWLSKLFLHTDTCKTEVIPATLKSTFFRPGLQFYSIRFSTDLHYDIWDDEQDVKMDCPGCSQDLPETHADGDVYTTVSFSGLIDGGTSIFHSSSFPIRDQALAARDPVIIVPGIIGSELGTPEKKIWVNVEQLALSPNDSFLDQLKLDSSGRPLDSSVVVGPVIKSVPYGIGTVHYMDGLLADLERMGYQEGKDLFFFPYDWRLGIDSSALRLRQAVEQVLAKTPDDKKVNIIAHSLGGLAAKKLLSDTDEFDQRIQNVTLVGVPHLGSAHAAKVLIFGDSLNIPLLDENRVGALVQNMPSIYQLLPTKEYFNRIPGYYDDLSDSSVKGILNYSGSKGLLQDLGKNELLLDTAEEIHESGFHETDFSVKPYELYNFVGCGKVTLRTINKMYTGNPSFVKKLIDGSKYRIWTDSGDGTVLLKSAEYLTTRTGNTVYFPNVIHNQMMQEPKMRDAIMAVLGGGNPTGSASSEVCAVKGRLLNLSSKVEFSVKDKQGASLIPGVDYEEQVIGEENFVSLPDPRDQEYEVSMRSPDPVNFSVTQYDENNARTNYFSNVATNTNNFLNLKMSQEGDSAVLEEEEGGAPDEVITPVESVDEGSSIDTVPPKTSIINTVTGTKPSTTSRMALGPDSRMLKITATDEGVGVRQTLYSFDEGITWLKADPTKAFEIPLGLGGIKFFSEDKMGNIEAAKNITFSWKGLTSTEKPKEKEEDIEKTPEPEDEEEEWEEEKNVDVPETEEDEDSASDSTGSVVEVVLPEGENVTEFPNFQVTVNNYAPAKDENQEPEVVYEEVVVRVEPFHSYWGLVKGAAKWLFKLF